MNLEQRVTDALDAAGAAHDGPADLWGRVVAEAERRSRRRRVAMFGAVLTAAAAGIIGVVLAQRPGGDRLTVDPANTTTTDAPSTTASTSGTTSTSDPSAAVVPPAPTPTPPVHFVGVLEQNKLAVGDASTGAVVRVLHTHPEAYGVSTPTLSRDGTIVYFVTRAINSETATVWRVPVAGGTPTKVMDGCGVVLSPDGTRAAVLGGQAGCRDGITVRTLSSGAVRHYPRGSFEESIVGVAWTADARSLLFSAAGEALPSRLYRLDLDGDRTVADAASVGPEGDSKFAWFSPELSRATGAIKVVEYCCMVDAEPPPSDTSDVLTIDPRTGAVLDRYRTPEDIEAVAVDPTGAAELYVGNRHELYRRDGTVFRKLTGTWSAIDW